MTHRKKGVPEKRVKMPSWRVTPPKGDLISQKSGRQSAFLA